MKGKLLFDLLPIAKKFYDFEKNTDVDATSLGVASKKEVWWRCPRCGNETRAKVCKKAKRQKDGSYVFFTCKNCYREFGSEPKAEARTSREKKPKISEVPELARLWDKAGNTGADPATISIGSRFPYNWKCPDCGCQWTCTPRALSLRHKKCLNCPSSKPTTGVPAIFALVPQAKEYYDFERNKNIDISTLTVSSSTTVWWKCPRCGDETYMPIVYKIRKNGGDYKFRGCSVCSRKNPPNQRRGSAAYVADTLSLLRIWDEEKNTGVSAESLLCNSTSKAWWKCPDCGYIWEKTVYRVNASGGTCPRCTQRATISAGYNDVFTLVPEAKTSYCFEKNANVDITSIGVASSTRIWWKCPACGKEQYSPVKNKIRRNADGTYSFARCACSIARPKKGPSRAKVVSENTSLMRIWDYGSNTIAPGDVMDTSTQKANWKCPKCGYTWSSQIRDAARSTGLCPCCDLRRVVVAGITDFLTLCPDLRRYYDSEKNRDVDTGSIGTSSNKRVWWRCPDCGYEFLATINSRIRKAPNGRYYAKKCRRCQGTGI